MTTGKINVPVKLVSATAGDWIQIGGDEVNLRVALDRKSASFTPSKNGVYKFRRGEEIFEVTVGDVVNPPPDPNPNPTPEPGTLLYDSNVDIDWASLGGQVKRVDDTFGGQSPNGKGFHMNASGNPRMFLDPATKELTLEHDGAYGRAYFCVCNYNSRLELEFKLDSCSNNCSLKTRNRHQYRELEDPNATDEETQGGIGSAYKCGTVEQQVEVVHGTNTLDKTFTLDPKAEAGVWYKATYTVQDVDGKVRQINTLDGKVVAQRDISPPSQFFNKAQFEEWSEFWIRLNAANGGQLKIRNIKLFQL